MFQTQPARVVFERPTCLSRMVCLAGAFILETERAAGWTGPSPKMLSVPAPV